MKKKVFAVLVISLMYALLLAGCGNSKSADKGSGTENVSEKKETKEKPPVKDKAEKKEKKAPDSGEKSLAQRMAGKYSFHNSDEDGNDEFYIMDVVPFGGNLYAFCGQAITEDYESLDPYTFWAAEFIPYDADEMTGPDGDSVTVNELRFSVMSNAGKYWDAGHKGKITYTADGLVFEGFDHDGFLVPGYDDSRLFLKDERVEDAFGYLRDGKGDEELEGMWVLESEGAGLYLRFAGANMYIYSKDPGAEVFFAAGGCDLLGGSLSLTASVLGNGGLPMELSGDYEVKGDTLTLMNVSSDFEDRVPLNGKYKKVGEGEVHVTTMDEVKLDPDSIGALDDHMKAESLAGQDYYGVFVVSAKTPDGCTPTIDKLEDAGFTDSFAVYTPDFSGLNPEPYYVATTGLYTSENEAKEVLSKAKAAGFNDAYVKKAGTYTGDKYCYTMHDGGNIELLKDGVMLRGVSVSIPYPVQAESLTVDLLVTDDAVFDKTAETEYFGNYEKGDTPYEWIVRNYNLMNDDPDKYMQNGPALSGVFEVGLEGNKIMSYYGSYWWD